MRHFIYQEDKNGCALAVLRMALIEATGQRNYRYLQLANHPPYSLDAISEAARKEGVDISFRKAERKEELEKCHSFPVLLLLREEGADHLVYCPKIKKDKALIYDPAIGPVWLKIREVMAKWSLVFGVVEMKEKKKCPYHRPRFVSSLSLALPCLISLASCFALYAGFFYVGENGNYLFSIALFAIYGLLALLEKESMMEAMRRFDKRWLSHLYDSPRERFPDDYERYYSFKKLMFPGFFGFVSSILIAGSLVILFGLNNPIFLIAVGFLIIYLASIYTVLHGSIEKKKMKVEAAEDLLLHGSSSKEKRALSIKKLNDESYRIGRLITTERIIYMPALFCFSAVTLIKAETATLNYYLLYFFALFSVGESLRGVLDYLAKRSEYEMAEAYFYEYFAKTER